MSSLFLVCKSIPKKRLKIDNQSSVYSLGPAIWDIIKNDFKHPEDSYKGSAITYFKTGSAITFSSKPEKISKKEISKRDEEKTIGKINITS